MYSLWKERPNQKEQAMSDNLRRYRAIRDALRQGYPEQPTGTVARHLTTLAALMSHTFRTLFVGSSMDFRVAPFANPALAVDTLCPEVLESCPLWPLVTLVSPWPA